MSVLYLANAMNAPTHTAAEHFLNRDLSVLAFNRRVLAQAVEI